MELFLGLLEYANYGCDQMRYAFYNRTKLNLEVSGHRIFHVASPEVKRFNG